MAAGSVRGYKVRDCIYLDPSFGDIDPIMPWGRFSRLWNLTGDFNRSSDDPHIKHEPAGLKFKITWKTTALTSSSASSSS